MSAYPEQRWDYGEFTCNSCGATFERADPKHGASGMCCQCEIAHGLIKIHGDNEETNAREQRETKIVIVKYKAFFSCGQ